MREAVERYAHALDPRSGRATVMSVRKARIISFLTRNKRLRYAADLMGYFEKVGEPGDASVANALLTTLDEWIATRGTALMQTA